MDSAAVCYRLASRPVPACRFLMSAEGWHTCLGTMQAQAVMNDHLIQGYHDLCKYEPRIYKQRTPVWEGSKQRSS